MSPEANIRLHQHVAAFDRKGATLADELVQRMEDHVRTQLWSRGATGLKVAVRRSQVKSGIYYVGLATPDGRRSVEITGEDCDRLISGLYHRVTAAGIIDRALQLDSAIST